MTEVTPEVAEDTGATVEEASETVGFGTDLLADETEPSESTQPQDGTEPGAEPPFDPETVDWASVRPDDVPEQYRPLIPTARRIQSQAHARESDLRRGTQETETAHTATLATMQAQIAALQGAAANTKDPEAANSNLSNDWMHQELAKMGVSESEDYSNGVVYMQLAEKVFSKLLSDRNFADGSKLEALEGKLTKTSEEATRTSDETRRDKLESELDAVYAKFGEDNVRPLLDEMAGLYGKPKPGGGNHTLNSAYVRLTGASGTVTKEQIRGLKKQAGPSTPQARGNGAIPEHGDLTDAQALQAAQILLDS